MKETSFPKFVLPTRHFVWPAHLCGSKRSESLGRKMKQLLFLVLVLAAASCRTQTMDKVSLASADADNLYINDGDSTALYYYQFVPKAAIKGVLVILPSGGESTENMLRQIQLQKRAVKVGILVVVPSCDKRRFCSRWPLQWGDDLLEVCPRGSGKSRSTFLDPQRHFCIGCPAR
jgi:hypothetical protein